MAIVNREKDASEQKEWIGAVTGNNIQGGTALSTGSSVLISGPMPYPFVVDSGRVYGIGLSSTPQIRLILDRFAGGQTRIVLSISNMVVPAYGTSGSFGLSGLAPAGSTLLNGLPGDVLSIDVVGANTAFTALSIQVAVKKTQDIVSMNNKTT